MVKFSFKKALLSSLAVLTFGSSALFAEDCNRRVFSIQVEENTNILEVLNKLSSVCDFSVIVKSTDAEANQILRHNLSSVNIKDSTLNEIFGILLSGHDLMYSFRKNVLSITSIDTRVFKIDYITSIREGRAVVKASADAAPVQLDDLNNQNQNGGNNQSQDNIIETTEKFDFWAQISSEVAAIMNNGKERFVAPAPVVNSNAGLLSVTGTKGQLERVANYVQKLNKSLKKQVMIDVRIVSVDLNNQYKHGIDWSQFSLGFNSFLGGNPNTPSQFAFGRWKNGAWDVTTPSTSAIKGGFILQGAININLDGVINFLDTTGQSRIVSSPKILTMNNQQALISVGDNINYQITNTYENTETKNTNTDIEQYTTFIGILLNLLPEVSDDGKIMLRINPSLSSFKYTEDNERSIVPRSVAPDTLQKKLSSVVHVNSGDTIVLGGLISQESGTNINKVPGLGDIPILGYLFKSEGKYVRNSELVFIITPTIIDVENNANTKDSLKSLGFSDGIF